MRILQREQALFMWSGVVGCLCGATVAWLIDDAYLAPLGCVLSFMSGMVLLGYVCVTLPRRWTLLHVVAGFIAMGACVGPLVLLAVFATTHR